MVPARSRRNRHDEQSRHHDDDDLQSVAGPSPLATERVSGRLGGAFLTGSCLLSSRAFLGIPIFFDEVPEAQGASFLAPPLYGDGMSSEVLC